MIGDAPFYDIINYTDSYGNQILRQRSNITFPVLNNKIETGEVINKTRHVYITGLYEIGIQDEIIDTSNFKVNYSTGTIWVHPSKNNTNLILSYFAEAQICYRAGNITLQDVNNNYASDNVEDALKENADRINNLILNTSNPAEVTDSHLDTPRNITYPTQKARLDKDSTDILQLENDLGDKTKLNTNDKTNLVNAVNEVESTLNGIPNQTYITEKAKTSDVNNLLILKANQSSLDTTNSNVLVNTNAINAHSAQIASLASGAPKPVSLVSQMTDHTKNYVYTGTEGGYTSGNWYYWNETAWTSGGVYQATGIASKSLTVDMMQYFTTGKNLFYKPDAIANMYIDYTTGTISGAVGFYASGFIPVVPGKTYTKNYINQFAYYDANKTYVSGVTDGTLTFTVPVNIYFARFTIPNADALNKFQVEEGSSTSNYMDYQVSIPSYLTANLQGVYRVAKYNGESNSIKSMIDDLVLKGFLEDVTVQVYPGTYEEVINELQGDKKISIVGTNKKSCILIDKSGDYYYSPLQIAGNAYIKNLSIKANHDKAGTMPNPTSYAVHSDYDYSGELVFEDCYFESLQNAAVGIGMHQDQTIKFKNCEFYSNSDYDGGAVYFHNAVASGITNQHLIFDNCRIISEKGVALKMDDANIGSGDGLGNDMDVTFINCMIYSKTLGKNCITINTAPIGAGTIVGRVKLGAQSYGNNIVSLNA